MNDNKSVKLFDGNGSFSVYENISAKTGNPYTMLTITHEHTNIRFLLSHEQSEIVRLLNVIKVLKEKIKV